MSRAGLGLGPVWCLDWPCGMIIIGIGRVTSARKAGGKMKIKTAWLAGVLAAIWLLNPGAAFADVNKGVAAADRGDYETALREFRSAAGQGDEIAQYNLGIMYKRGLGVAVNRSEAVKWYRLAAEQGFPEAQYALGVSYFLGEGVGKNEAEGLRLFRLAADGGFDEAQIALGLLYEDNHPVLAKESELSPIPNSTKAADWYRKAAEQGNVDAQYYLAKVLDNSGVAWTEALHWYRMAAVGPDWDARAQTALGRKYEQGSTGVDQSYSVAFRWYRAAADQGFGEAQFWLGWLFILGKGVEKDETEGFRLHRLAAENGYYLAQHQIGRDYLTWDFPEGFEYPPNRVEVGLMWLMLAARHSEEEIIEEELERALKRYSLEEKAEALRMAKEWEEQHQ